MNNSGDAAEQVVCFSLEGTEVALKLTGSAAKNIAAAMYAVLKNKDKNKLKGHQRLTAMLKSGKELKVFTIRKEHLKRFAREAKRYGAVYCALRSGKKCADGMVDVMVRAEDASKINRIVERFKMATVDAAAIESEPRHYRERNTGHATPFSLPDVKEDALEESQTDALLADLLDTPEKEDAQTESNPLSAQTEKAHPSAPVLEKPGRDGKDISESIAKRPSVREELKDIRVRRKKEDMRESANEPKRTWATAEKRFPGGKSPGKKKRKKVR